MKSNNAPNGDDTILVNLDFFEGDIDMFVELYKELQKRLLPYGYNGYFDNVIFSREWWESISLFFQLGFAYEAITHIEKVDDPQFFGRKERRILLKIKDKEQLCKDAKEYLINYLYNIFFKLKTTSYGTIMLKEGNFIDPKFAKNQFLLHYITNYGYSKSKKMHGIYLQAIQGYSEDTTSQILSIDVLQVMNLVRVITVRGEKHVVPSHTGVESSTTKRTIEVLNQRIETLEETNERSVSDYNTLVDSHNQLIEIYNAATDENGKLENEIHLSKKKIETLENSVSRIPTLQQTIQFQTTVILYLQDGNIQPLFELNHPCFQSGFRAILRRYISDIADTIGPHLSSTTSHTTVGSGSFSYHVINPLLNQIGQLLDTPDWNGMIHMRNLLYLPKNGDPSKGSIYEFAEHSKNIPSLCFIDFFNWISQQRKIGNHDFSTVFETIAKRIKEKTPALHREIRDYTAKKITELSK